MATTKQAAVQHPLARSEQLIIEQVGHEAVIYDLETNDAHALKPLAAAVFMYADGDRTVAEIAELAAYRLAAPVTEDEVNDALRQLDSLALLATPPTPFGSGISRRTALKTFAAVGAGTMLISTVTASAASLANSTAQTALGDGTECVLGTVSYGSKTGFTISTSVNQTVTPGSSQTQPSGVMVPGEKSTSGSPESGTTYTSPYYNYVFPEPGITEITISGGTEIITASGGTETTINLNTTTPSGGWWSSSTGAPNVTYGEACNYLAYNAASTASGTASFSSGTKSITVTVKTGTIAVGMSVSGSGIAGGTTVTAVSKNSNGTYAVTLSASTNGTETSKTLTFSISAYYSEAAGVWQCIPCDGNQDYQCCSVVCGPSPAIGFTWGASATVPGGNAPNAYEGCGTDDFNGVAGVPGGNANCLNPGTPDYMETGYVGKFCTSNGGKPKS